MQLPRDLRARLDRVAFFSVPEAARLLDCDQRTVRKAIAAGDIPATKVGTMWRIPTAWLRNQLTAGDGK